MLPARRIPRFLKVHPEVDQISKNLDMALWLHVASHHAKTQPSRNSGGTSFRNGPLLRSSQSHSLSPLATGKRMRWLE